MNHIDSTQYKIRTIIHLDDICREKDIKAELALKIKAGALIFPFKTNDYILGELIDWQSIPDDPLFRLTFPHTDMLDLKDAQLIIDAVKRNADSVEIAQLISKIRSHYYPTDTVENNEGIPVFKETLLSGVMKLTPGTLLLFPKPFENCFAYCSYCFRWSKSTGNTMEFSYSDPKIPVRYLHEDRSVTNCVFSGGDPLTVPVKILKRYIDPLLRMESIRSICFTTKALGWWPHRFFAAADAKELFAYFKHIIRRGKHVSIIAHFSHPRELTTKAVYTAIGYLRKNGVIIRCQGPLLRSINNSGKILSDMWQREVEMGMVPYYLFVESDCQSRHYFKIPLIETLQIFNDAQKKVSSLAKTVQGPVIMHEAKKILLSNVVQLNDRKLLAFKYLEHPDQKMVNETFYTECDTTATHMSQLKIVPSFKSVSNYY